VSPKLTALACRAFRGAVRESSAARRPALILNQKKPAGAAPSLSLLLLPFYFASASDNRFAWCLKMSPSRTARAAFLSSASNFDTASN